MKGNLNGLYLLVKSYLRQSFYCPRYLPKGSYKMQKKKISNFSKKFEKFEIFEKNHLFLKSILKMFVRRILNFFCIHQQSECGTLIFHQNLNGHSNKRCAIKRKRRLWFWWFTLLSKNVELGKFFTSYDHHNSTL